jgi:hypothetical protein
LRSAAFLRFSRGTHHQRLLYGVQKLDQSSKSPSCSRRISSLTFSRWLQDYLDSKIRPTMALALLKLVLVYLWTSLLVSSQSIYIDRDPAYYALPCCAQTPLSIAVRDMSQGCGDGSALTSYDCFCTTSSSYFSSLISTEVAGQCGNATVALQAISVFNNYCAVGPNGTQPTAGG